MKRTKSSARWLKEHFSDAYVKKAQTEGYRARSVYKLIEIQSSYKIVKPNMIVVDLGAAPGGWSEYLAKLVKPNGKVYALDILPMQPIVGVEITAGDFTQEEIVGDLLRRIGGQKVDVVVSDMAPNLSGIAEVDDLRSLNLVEAAFEFSKKVLKGDGVFLAKLFQGGQFSVFLQRLRQSFAEVKIIKPAASRSRSKEVYILAKRLINISK